MADSAISGDANDAALLARDFRVALEHRRDIDDLVADAVAVRQRATVEAVEIVRAAEALAEEIVADARQEAARVAAERDRLHEALGERVSATIHRLESMASEVHMALDGALAEVSESFSHLADPLEPGPVPAAEEAADDRTPDDNDDAKDSEVSPDVADAAGAGAGTEVDDLDGVDDVNGIEDPAARASGPDTPPKIAGWTDNIPDRPVRAWTGPRSERWRDRFRQER